MFPAEERWGCVTLLFTQEEHAENGIETTAPRWNRPVTRTGAKANRRGGARGKQHEGEIKAEHMASSRRGERWTGRRGAARPPFTTFLSGTTLITLQVLNPADASISGFLWMSPVNGSSWGVYGDQGASRSCLLKHDYCVILWLLVKGFKKKKIKIAGQFASKFTGI